MAKSNDGRYLRIEIINQPPFNDDEVRQAVDGAPSTLPYSEIASMLGQRFGTERAWSADQVRQYLMVARGRRGRIERDPELHAFIMDWMDRVDATALAEKCRERFGEKAPSRSAIHRFVQQCRSEYRSRTIDRRTLP